MSSQFVCHTLPLLHHGAIQEPLYSLFSKIDCNHLRMGLISYLYRTFTIVCAHATALQQRDWHAPVLVASQGAVSVRPTNLTVVFETDRPPPLTGHTALFLIQFTTRIQA